MASKAVQLLAKHLTNLSATARVENLPDRELVQRFASRRDEDAFAALMRRHGPMVLRVCRRILHDVHDAEDVFQAVFLVFSRKAASLRRGEAVGCWLHQTAYRLSMKARTELARQRKRDHHMAKPTAAADPLAELSVREWQAILDEELTRLPEKYRAPLVLCCLEGQTRDEAARQLGCSAKLIKSRLEAARERLRDRLIRRGLTLPAALAASLLTEENAPAALPPLLVRATVQAAQSWPANGASPMVARLTESALRGTGMVKAKVAVGLLLLTSALVAGLGAFAPSRDRYGDPLPPGALARLGTLRFRTGHTIEQIAFSPDGKLLATATYYPDANMNSLSISVWDRVSGKRLRRINFGKKPPFAIAFAPDGNTFAAQERSGEIRLWDVRTGKELRRDVARGIVPSAAPHELFLPGGISIRGLGFAFTPDGRALAARGTDKALHFRETTTGKELRKLTATPEDFSPLTFSRDGKLLAAAGKKMIRLWDWESGKEKIRLRGHDILAGAPAFSADGKTFAAMGRTPGQLWQVTAYVWDIASGKLLHQWSFPDNPVFTCGISPDGKKALVAGRFNEMRLYDLANGKEIRRLIAPFTDTVFAAAFSPDGKTIAVGGGNLALQLWDTESGKLLSPFTGHQGVIESISLSANGKYLASVASEQRILLWNTATSQLLGALGTPKWRFFSAAYSPDARTLAVADDAPFVRLLEMPSGKEIRRLASDGDRNLSVAFSPDGRLLAAGSGDSGHRGLRKSVGLWEAATGKLLHRLPVPRAGDSDGGILSLAFSPDGRLLASGGYGEFVQVWNVDTGQLYCQLPGHEDWVPCLRFSPDGQTLAATHGDRAKHSIRLWEVRSGKERGRLIGHSERVSQLAFAPDGRLASAGDDGTIRIWDVDRAETIGCFRGHESRVGPLAFSSDGQRLVSGGWDTTILVWDMKSLPQKPASKVELSPRECEALWIDLADTDAAKAHRAIRTLIQGRQSVSFLKDRLPPIQPAPADKIAAWIADLGSDQFAARSKAEAELQKLEKLAEPALRRVVRDRTSSAESRRRIERLLQRLQGPIASAETLRRLRAIEVLEHIGSPEARHVLRALAEGAPSARLTREAKAALERTKSVR